MSVIQQEILSGSQYPPTLTVHHVSAKDAARQFKSSEHGAELIGIASHLSSKGEPDFICLARSNGPDIFRIPLKKSKFEPIADFLCANEASSHPLASKVSLVGFGMTQIALQICQVTNLRVKGVDLLTLFGSPGEPSCISKIITDKVDKNAKKSAMRHLWKASVKNNVALRAWLAACVGGRRKEEVTNAVKMDTGHLTRSEVACLSQLVIVFELLEKIKPREVQNDFSTTKLDKQGHVLIQNERYKTRVRPSGQTHVIMIDSNNDRFKGTATESKGKMTTVRLRKGKAPSGKLRSVTVVGLPELTDMEMARNELVYLALSGKRGLQVSSFIGRLWFPGTGQTTSRSLADSIISPMRLNNSQRTAMRAMVGDSPIVIVHGPPGTGKTTTITAAAQVWDSRNLSVWIVAHSNVAVKNIAEKLFDNKVEFRILVSKEFHEEWHEHIYESIEEKLIRSDDFPKEPIGMERLILDSKVILCTLSMMLNSKLHNNKTFEIVPPRCLVIDEASQINSFELMPVLVECRKHLEKICFFGDPLQLPPFGKDDVPQIKTIFDFEHLNRKEDTYFLNTQYRMPNPIAQFISHNVYEGRLLSEHKIVDPKCLVFIDVPRTGEKSDGTSTKNLGEVATVVHLVKQYYRNLNFCIITPYDAQRGAIQNGLKAEKLPWEKVYNVDSFQGNEADYVIISLVRSSHTGFLHSVQRMNVMLTRCRRGLIIVSSQNFLGPEGKGSDTLVGKLVQYWQETYGHKWIDWRSVADGSVDLPGAIRSKKVLNTSTPRTRSNGNSEQQQKPSSSGKGSSGQRSSPEVSKVQKSNSGSRKQPQQRRAKKTTL